MGDFKLEMDIDNLDIGKPKESIEFLMDYIKWLNDYIKTNCAKELTGSTPSSSEDESKSESLEDYSDSGSDSDSDSGYSSDSDHESRYLKRKPNAKVPSWKNTRAPVYDSGSESGYSSASDGGARLNKKRTMIRRKKSNISKKRQYKKTGSGISKKQKTSKKRKTAKKRR